MNGEKRPRKRGSNYHPYMKTRDPKEKNWPERRKRKKRQGERETEKERAGKTARVFS